MSISKYINIYILILFLILSSSQEQYEDDKHKKEDDIPPPDKPDKNKNKKFDYNLNDMNNLKKKYESIIKENNNSKEKLKKYNFYYYTFEILNIIFALFIFTYFMNQIFKFYKFRYNVRVNPENSVSNVEIKNNFNNENENNDIDKNENQNNEQKICEIKNENNYIKDIGAPPATAFFNEDSN